MAHLKGFWEWPLVGAVIVFCLSFAAHCRGDEQSAVRDMHPFSCANLKKKIFIILERERAKGTLVMGLQPQSS